MREVFDQEKKIDNEGLDEQDNEKKQVKIKEIVTK